VEICRDTRAPKCCDIRPQENQAGQLLGSRNSQKRSESKLESLDIRIRINQSSLAGEGDEAARGAQSRKGARIRLRPVIMARIRFSR
jgi:hypothetical protein